MSDSTPGAEATGPRPGEGGLGLWDGPGALARLRDILPGPLAEVLERAIAIARIQGRPLWVVGGVVRDALLGRPSTDLDLMVEPLTPETLPAADPFVADLAASLGAARAFHDVFRTAVLSLPGGLHVDVAQSREERYAEAAALPQVAPAEVGGDLARRDFTINAIALEVVGPGAPALLDPLGGRGDLRAGVLRILHPGSFVDDPTRIFRGLRFLARLGYDWAPETRALAEDALSQGLPDRLSAHRLGHELRLLAAEPTFGDALLALRALGGLGSIGPVALTPQLLELLPALQEDAPPSLLTPPGPSPEGPGDARLLALAATAPASSRPALLTRWDVLGAAQRRWLADLHSLPPLEAALLGDAPPSQILPPLRALGEAARRLLWAQLGTAPGDARRRLEALAPRLTERSPVDGRDLIAAGWTPGPGLGTLLHTLEGAYLDGAFRTREEGLSFARRLEEGA